MYGICTVFTRPIRHLYAQRLSAALECERILNRTRGCHRPTGALSPLAGSTRLPPSSSSTSTPLRGLDSHTRLGRAEATTGDAWLAFRSEGRDPGRWRRRILGGTTASSVYHVRICSLYTHMVWRLLSALTWDSSRKVNVGVKGDNSSNTHEPRSPFRYASGAGRHCARR